MAQDTLVRNHNDAFIFTGIVWTTTINIYLLSDLNVSYDVTLEQQIVMITSMFNLNLLHLVVFMMLKSFSLYDASDRKETQKKTEVSDIQEERRHSCVDGRSLCLCCSSRARNIIMLIAVGLSFFLLPLVLLLMAVGSQFKNGKTMGQVEPSNLPEKEADKIHNMGTGRLLEDELTLEEESEPLAVVLSWVFISLGNTVVFSFTMLTPLLNDLFQQTKDPSKVKIKHKALGGYSDIDPKRHLSMRESIFSLAFAANLKNSFLDKQGVPEECRPSSMQRAEVNLTAMFCAFA